MSDRRDTIRDWWGTNLGDRKQSSVRALAARLNRGGGVSVLAERAVYNLGRSLGLLEQPSRLVPLVQVLAAVRVDGGGVFAGRLGQGDTPPLSALRFQRLIRAEGEELAILIRRALPMVDRTCDVGRLGSDLLAWDDDTRARWAFAYFGASAPDRLSPAASDSRAAETDEETDV